MDGKNTHQGEVESVQLKNMLHRRERATRVLKLLRWESFKSERLDCKKRNLGNAVYEVNEKQLLVLLLGCPMGCRPLCYALSMGVSLFWRCRMPAVQSCGVCPLWQMCL